MKLAYKIMKSKGGKLTLSDIRFFDENGNERELTYWLHDYGRLAYWLRKYGQVDDYSLWLSLLDIFVLDEAFGNMPTKKRTKWYLWHIDKLQEIGATEKVEKGKYRLGNFGKLAFEAVKGSPNWSTSIESIIIARLISRRIENLGLLLSTINLNPIDAICDKSPRGINRPQDFQISWNDLSTNLQDSYFIHTESPTVIPDHKSPNSPVVLSGVLLNEIYFVISNIRERIVEKLVNVGDTVNPYILTDRGSYEIKRGLERLNILQRKYGSWFTSIPDQLLSSIAMYSLVKKGQGSISPHEFTEIFKEDFRFLVDPDDIIDFLTNSVKYQAFGINLDVLRNNLEQNYSNFIERLVSLGFATIRPDGEAKIETPKFI